jgi:hypothetical protein
MAEAVNRYRHDIGGGTGTHWAILMPDDKGPVVYHHDYEALAQRNRELARIAQALVDGMETCHECKGTVLVDEYPIHCEDCSSMCENHEGAECATIYGLHLALKRALLPNAAPGGEAGR